MSRELKLKPIFLHGLWRAGTTYVWSKFRAAPECCCFYEPLHHGLARLTPERITRDTQDITEGNTHPDLATPYFQEFEPLIAGHPGTRGVQHFKKELAYDRFWLSAGDKHEGLKTYIQSLINHAQAQEKTPVLGFNRTVFRLPWLKENFDAYHLYIDRDPREIWWSYERHRQNGNNTFFTAWLRIIDRNRDQSLCAGLAGDLGMKARLLRIKDKEYYKSVLKRLSQEQTYDMVFRLWQATQVESLSFCNYVYNMRSVDESGYVQSAAQKLEQDCGLCVDFSDAKRVALSEAEQKIIDFEVIEKSAVVKIKACA